MVRRELRRPCVDQIVWMTKLRHEPNDITVYVDNSVLVRQNKPPYIHRISLVTQTSTRVGKHTPHLAETLSLQVPCGVYTASVKDGFPLATSGINTSNILLLILKVNLITTGAI